MNRSLEAGYGSPQNPELVGTAQRKLSEVPNTPNVLPLARAAGELVVRRALPAETLEGVEVVTQLVERRTKVSHEMAVLDAYRSLYNDEPGVVDIQTVEDTQMVPPGLGVELGFETVSGEFFTSTGPDLSTAMADGVAYALLPKDTNQ
ncbi:hypothetical protein BH09PAT1_BH09PAT1_1020 [soil metagenome]